jgi:Uma2 family endonuclease
MGSLPLRKRELSWTDLLARPEGERWELIDGEPFAMSPATTRHQFIVTQLGRQLANHFHGKKCRLWLAPMAVKLTDHDVVEPDLFVVCDPRQVKRTHIEGAPTLVIEILSESTLRHDRVRKFGLYELHGVKEYWIIHPYPSLLEVYVLSRGRFRLAGGYEKHEVPRSRAFPDLKLDLGDVFSFPIEPGEEIQMLRESLPPYAATREQ